MASKIPKAVIGGIAARLPNSSNLQEFWNNLFSDSDDDMLSSSRWPNGLYDLPDKNGQIPNLDRFDNDYFNIPASEVNQMNPIFRQMLEVMYECIVDSCLPLQEFQSSCTGVYIACSRSDTDCIETSRYFNSNHNTTMGHLATELTQWFKFTGPSITVNSGTSSSMAALKLAVSDLLLGRCNYAFVTGCDIVLNPLVTKLLHLLDSDRLRSEGCMTVLLARKPEDLPRVYCNVVDIGINCTSSMDYTDNSKVIFEVLDSVDDNMEKDRKWLYINSVGVYAKIPATEDKIETDPNLTAENEMKTNNFSDSNNEECHLTIDNKSSNAISNLNVDVENDFKIDVRSNVECLLDNEESKIENLLLTSNLTRLIGCPESLTGLLSFITCLLAYQNNIPLTGEVFKEKFAEKVRKVCDGYVEESTLEQSPISRKDKGVEDETQYYMVIEPYLSNRDSELYMDEGHLLLPFTVRNIEGLSALKEFVQCYKNNIPVLGLISQSMMSCDENQPIRGYMYAKASNNDLMVYHDLCNTGLELLYLCLDNFMFNYVDMASDLLQLDCFYIALEHCQKSINLLEPRLNIMSILQNGEPLSPCTKTGILVAAAASISLIDTFETFGIEFDGSIGCGLSEIIAAYMDGCITRDQCFMVYSVIGEQLEQFSQKHGDKWCIYHVDMCSSEAYQLGPWVQVLEIYDKLHVTLAIEKHRCQQILDKIHLKGGSFERSKIDLPVYSLYMKDVANSVYEQLKDIIPSPVRRSHHLISARTGWNQCGIQQQVLYDAEYISQLLCHPVNLFEAQTVSPPDCLILSLKLSLIKDIDKSVDDVPVMKKGLQMSMTSTCNVSRVSTLEVPDHIICDMSVKSLFHAIGKLHIQGIPVNVSFLYNDEISDWPAGIEVPSLSPLVSWNHQTIWRLPHWLEFSATVKDERPPYMIEISEDDHRPVAVILYHIWQAIYQHSDKEESACSIRLYNITCIDASILHDLDLNGTYIYVLPKTQIFCLILEDEILMKGKFDVVTPVDLPGVPGYDLDINENIDLSTSILSESICEKSEIQWEDGWLDFMDKLLEFGEENIGMLPSEVLVNVDYHLQEAKDCSNFLAVAEKYTGLCRAGGLVYRYTNISVIDDIDAEKTCITITSEAIAQHLMVYSLPGYKNNKILLFHGTKESNKHPMVGIVNFSGEAELTELDVTYDFNHTHLETFIPYILAAHVVFNVAMVTGKQHVAILPPLDSVSMYMIVLCLSRKCKVYTSTCDLETKQFLEGIFPSLNVQHDDDFYKEIMCQTHGDGVDVCIRVSGGDLQKFIGYIGKNGHAIQCTVPDENSQYLELSYHGNNSVTIVDSSQAISSFIKDTNSDFQDLTTGIKNEIISKLHDEGFPEAMGMLYKQELDMKLEAPVCVNYLLQRLMEPHTGSNVDSLSQHDASCIKKIQNLVSPRPLDFSVADTSCLLESTRDYYKENTLNTGLIKTPSTSRNCLSPEVNIILFSDSFTTPTSEVVKSGTSDHSFSTSLLHDAELLVHNKVEESYFEDDCTETSFHIYNDSMRDDPDDIETTDYFEKLKHLEKHDSSGKHGDLEKCEANGIETCTPSVHDDDKAVTNETKDETLDKIVDGNKMMVGKVGTLRDGQAGLFDTPSYTNRVLIEEENNQLNDIHRDRRSNKSGQEKEVKINNGDGGKTSNDSLIISEVLANRSPSGIHDRSVNKRLCSLGFDRPLTPIAKSKDGDLSRHRMLQRLSLVPPKLPLPIIKVDLLVFGRPMTPHTPDLQEVISPRMAPSVVSLNSVNKSDIPPLFIVHAITGCTIMFQALTKQLDFQCYGLQITSSTPTGSITEMARFYKEVIVREQINGPYRIAGHSYSTILALEIAICLQNDGLEVDYLIMLDGSPLFTQQQINQGLKHLTSKSNKSEIDEALSIGSLISWIDHYGHVQNKLLTYGILKKLPSLDERIDTAVDISFGTTIISCCPIKTRWLTAKQRLLQMLRSAEWKTERLADTAREIIRLKRRQRAVEFMKQMQLAYSYQMTKTFTGDINLFRVEDISGIDVSPDYGLQTMCSGKVHVKQYPTSPNKFIASETLKPLAVDLNAVLNNNT